MTHLVKCAICNGFVSTDAERCPHCGAVSFRRTGKIEKRRYLEVKIIESKCTQCGGSGNHGVKCESHAAVGGGYFSSRRPIKCSRCGGIGAVIQVTISESGRVRTRNLDREWDSGDIQIDDSGPKKQLIRPYPGYVTYEDGYLD